MSLFNIALRSDLADFEIKAPLDGITYTIQFKWNWRFSAWFFHVLNEAGDTVLMGDKRAVVSWLIGVHFTGRSPPGCFFFFDTSGQEQEPGLNDLGGRVQLYYADAAELGL